MTEAGRERALHLAYVMSRFPKLTETFILREMVAMERLGVRVDVYPLLRERADVIHPAAAAYVARAHYLPLLSASILASQWYFLRERRRRRRYLQAFADMIRGTWRSPNFLLGGIGIFAKTAHAARSMSADGVDHVHCHFASHPALAGFLIHRFVGIPFSFTAHGSDLHVDRTMLQAKVAESAFTVTISEDNRQLIESTCGPASVGRVEVIHSGVDPAAFPAARDRAGGPLRIIAVGTLHEVKGQRHLIDACRRLRDAGVVFDCRFIGDGPDRQRLSDMIQGADLGNSVTIVGHLTTDDVARELADADVLVAPSVPTRGGKREGIPVVLMEAMAAGLPVIASRLSGIPELVSDGSSGILVTPGDDKEIAQALTTLATDPDLRKRMGLAGREIVADRFDALANAARLAERIRTSLGAPASVGAGSPRPLHRIPETTA